MNHPNRAKHQQAQHTPEPLIVGLLEAALVGRKERPGTKALVREALRLHYVNAELLSACRLARLALLSDYEVEQSEGREGQATKAVAALDSATAKAEGH